MLCLQAEKQGCETKLLACIQGGQYAHERERHAAGVAQHRGISGVFVGGLGTGEDPAMRAELIGASVLGLPSELPRFLAAGIGKPLPLPESAFLCSQGPGCLMGKLKNGRSRPVTHQHGKDRTAAAALRHEACLDCVSGILMTLCFMCMQSRRRKHWMLSRAEWTLLTPLLQ